MSDLGVTPGPTCSGSITSLPCAVWGWHPAARATATRHQPALRGDYSALLTQRAEVTGDEETDQTPLDHPTPTPFEQQLSDRVAVIDLLVRDLSAVDDHRLDSAVVEVTFTPDARWSGPTGPR